MCFALDEAKPRKRGRPSTKTKPAESPVQRPPTSRADPSPRAQTPRTKQQALTQASPRQASAPNPPKAAPAGKNVKALPTVRDHTTDQLNPEGDEYIAREFDDAGEKKVTPTGHLVEGREYRCRTFYVPDRGQKLFMLATECARVLNYRDSYLLFNKNRSLHKIIASQMEKEDLIRQEILPYSYRSRQIAIATARSMYRQFGARMIVNGRRVRDDYWETKARKQGFTEEDLAGEKRPGVTKQKEAATMEHTQVNTNAMNVLAHGEIVYANAPSHFDGGMHMGGAHPGVGGMVSSNLGQLPMMNLTPSDDPRLREYGNALRPRQELGGAPYLDRSLSNPSAELINQAAQTAEYNKAINQQRAARGQYLQKAWNRPHEIDTSRTAQPPAVEQEGNMGQTTHSPAQSTRNPSTSGASPHQMMGQQHSSQSHMMTPQQYAQQLSHQEATAQSPIQRMSSQVRPEQMQHQQRASNYTYGSAVTAPSGGSMYGYPQNQMWMTPQQQSSPVPTTHHLPQYGQPQSHHSPHSQQSPHHPPPQLPQTGYQGMSAMGAPGYSGMSGRSLYQPGQSPQQYMPQSSATQQPGMQQWAPPGTSAPGQSSWHGF